MRRRARSSNSGHTARNFALSSGRLRTPGQHSTNQRKMVPLFLYAALTDEEVIDRFSTCLQRFTANTVAAKCIRVRSDDASSFRGYWHHRLLSSLVCLSSIRLPSIVTIDGPDISRSKATPYKNRPLRCEEGR